MLRKKLSITLAFLFYLSIIGTSYSIQAQSIPNTLVIYSLSDEEQWKEIRILDAVIGQFEDEYAFVQDNEVKTEDIENASRVVYFGAGKTSIPFEIKQTLNHFNGNLYAIGHNVEQLTEKLNWFNINGESLVNHIEFSQKDMVQKISEERIVYNIDAPEETIWMYAFSDEQEKVPLITEKNGNYYFTAQSLFTPVDGSLSESLLSFFDVAEDGYTRYLRLEDIHPMVNADQLREQAEYLKEKEIPYMAAVIPVYTKDNDEIIHLSDSPELVETLKYMQENGASIVLHGYRHQYRSSETGEGFEFWDVENDRPIYQDAMEEPKLRDDFNSDEEYDDFIEQGLQFEKGYIQNAIQKGTEELVAHDLYPLAFEAPHYAMSEQGYKILSQHFSSYVGRLQLTNSTWQGEYTPIFESSPLFIHGMTVYPETVGFIEENNEQTIVKMQEEIKNMQYYNRAYISAFYHPYLGLDGLKGVVESLESIENATWFDLKNEGAYVQVNAIKIEAKNGEITVTKPFFSSEYEKKLKIKQSLVYIIPITIFLIVAVLILIGKIRKRYRS